MSRISKLLALALIVVFCCGSAWAADRALPKYLKRATPVIVDSRDFVGAPETGSTFGVPLRPGASALAPVASYQMGVTYYDYQHNGTVGRQVDESFSGSSGKIQVSWMKAPGPSVSIRTVNWNSRSVTGVVPGGGGDPGHLTLGGEQIPGGQEFSAVRPGYTNTRNRVNGKNITLYHDAPEVGGVQFTEAQLDLTSGSGVFNTGTPSTHPQEEATDHQTDGIIWPKATITEDPLADTPMVYHTIGSWSGAANESWYWRGAINDASALITWDSTTPEPDYPIMIDSVDAFITAAIEAFADTVLIAQIKQIDQTNADIVLYKSTDNGRTWPTVNVPSQNITNYTSADPEGANTHLNLAYDSTGVPHVVWETAPANGQAYPANLYHWSPVTGIRLITSAGWINSCGGGTLGTSTNNGAGTNNSAISEVGITVKPAGAGGIGEERIYVIWSQYGPTDTDCSTVDDQGTLGGGVNAEIYWSVSTNGGATWDRPQNLTNTVTPDCAPGDCFSEGWTTTAAWADSAVYVSYVEDKHSGAIVFGGGNWTENPYKVMAPLARPAVLEPVIAVTPTQFIELNAKPSGGVESVDLRVISVGNDNLTYTVEVVPDGEAENQMQVEGSGSVSGAITAGDPPDVLSVTFSAAGLSDPSEHNWQLKVTSNDPQNDPGQGGDPIFVDLQVFAAETWWTCQEDTLSTGQHRMQISACLEMADEGGVGLGFYNYADQSEWMFSGSAVVTTVMGADTVAYHNAFMSPFDRTRGENKSFRAQSDFNVVRDSAFSTSNGDTTIAYTADVAYGDASTTDTTIRIDYTAYFPKNPDMAKAMLWKFKMYNVSGAPINGIHYGAAADIDLDNDAADNQGRGSETEGWIGGVGGEADTVLFTANNNYMALFHVPLDGNCTKGGAVAAQVLANYAYVHPENSFNTDSLYTLYSEFGALGSWGINSHGDTGDVSWDIAAMLETGYNLNLGVTDTVEWGYGVAVSDVGTSDLEATIKKMREMVNADCLPSGCPMPLNVSGDVNADGVPTAADVITLVNWIFKQTANPSPCDAAGDVNCDGVPTAADIITEVNFVFKSMALPCHQCDSPLASEC